MSIKVRIGTDLVEVANLFKPDFVEKTQVVANNTTAIDVALGTMIEWTATGPKTLSGLTNFVNGASITLMIEDGTVNWGTVINRWVFGAAPDISAPGIHVVTVWRIGNLNYGAYVGNAT